MSTMMVIVFGNTDLPEDSLPLRILPQLRERFLEVEFLTLDPNEEWPLDSARGKDEELTIIDTVQGIKDIQVFVDLDTFSAAPRLSMHDFDALANLQLLKKLGKIKSVKIIGVPPGIGEQVAIQKISAQLTPTQP